ncbi:BON domain-containing protein [Pseudomonas sp. BN607]|uniref:BON domain-containing protein n=1 Tax=Pseudomonas sp. BN607 TaxID=2567895 RepID=UPI0024565693|nr:BON domain-containing protein [Pseudomonas sp. BN607]MDH4550428.1 BON domain-containing protein [Pseudomonas sp. BN607]
MNDLDLRDLVLEELEVTPDINAASIGVTVQDGVVKLEGKVHLLREREVVERAAWSVPGVSKVEDYLLIA